MNRALISIDYTNDFVADDGKLTAGVPAQAIENAITTITKKAYQNGDYIFFAIDGHGKGDIFHPETKLFPPHNINGTSGRDLYGSLGRLYQEIKDDTRVFWLDKRHYSAFSGTDLDIRLRERGRDLYGSLGRLYQEIKDDTRVFWLDKRHYSAFSGTDLDIRLRERGVRTVVLTGVLTDICVLHTAIDAYNLGYQIEIPSQAVASLTEENHEWALRHFEHVLGAKVIS